MTFESSMEQKLNACTYAAFRLIYSDPDFTKVREPCEGDLSELQEIAFSWADGGPQNRIMRYVGGRTSLAEAISFDIAEEESNLDTTLDSFIKEIRSYCLPDELQIIQRIHEILGFEL